LATQLDQITSAITFRMDTLLENAIKVDPKYAGQMTSKSG